MNQSHGISKCQKRLLMIPFTAPSRGLEHSRAEERAGGDRKLTAQRQREANGSLDTIAVWMLHTAISIVSEQEYAGNAPRIPQCNQISREGGCD